MGKRLPESDRSTPDGVVRGGAAHPRYRGRPNPGGIVRASLEEILEIGRRNGVEVDDELFRWTIGGELHPGHNASYFQLEGLQAETPVPWKRFLDRNGRVHVKISTSILGSDDELLGTLIHEVEEIRALQEEYRRSSWEMPAARLRALVEPGTGRLHSAAWDAADAVILPKQQAGEWP